jgi:transcriptional regulator with XRE-family HTH domain
MTDDAAVPRISAAVDDRTPLTASRIDVAARIGWLLRSHRSVGGLSLRQMSTALRDHDVSLSAATLSRIESEGQPSVAALEGYARVLGLPEGTLLGAVAVLCRSFHYGPQLPSPSGTRSLERFSEAFEAIDQEAPSGAAWLEFAAHHADPAGFGLPRTEMAPRVRRLASELCRSSRGARYTRLEALSLLRCSPYGELVEEVLRPLILEPHAQNYWDLFNALGERPTPSLLDWCGSLLRDTSLYRAQGASYVIQSLLVLGGLDRATWLVLIDHAERARLEAGDDPARKAMLVQLYDALPPRLRELVREDFRP